MKLKLSSITLAALAGSNFSAMGAPAHYSLRERMLLNVYDSNSAQLGHTTHMQSHQHTGKDEARSLSHSHDMEKRLVGIVKKIFVKENKKKPKGKFRYWKLNNPKRPKGGPVSWVSGGPTKATK